MALYVIADLHLSLGADKPMDVFGGRWEGYMDKLRAGLAVIGPEDTTVLPGDLSWALGIEQAKEDFAFISAIPGRKILLKGNHDYWWTTAAHDEKVFRRELGRLETSLKAAGKREKLCFLHYPPRYQGYECPEILELLERYGVRRCYYGHLHAESHRLALQGNWHGIEFQLVSADYVNFKPVKILD